MKLQRSSILVTHGGHARRLGQAAVVAHVVEPGRVDALGYVGCQHTITNTHARRSELVHAPTLSAPAPAAPIAQAFKCASGTRSQRSAPRLGPAGSAHRLRLQATHDRNRDKGARWRWPADECSAICQTLACVRYIGWATRQMRPTNEPAEDRETSSCWGGCSRRPISMTEPNRSITGTSDAGQPVVVAGPRAAGSGADDYSLGAAGRRGARLAALDAARGPDLGCCTCRAGRPWPVGPDGPGSPCWPW